MMAPPMQPTLSDDAVILRPLVADDWDALFGVASDPEIWAVHPSRNRWQQAVFRAYFNEALASGGGIVVRDAQTNAVIGASRYDGDNAEDGEIEIGWSFLARSHWGGHYNRAVKRLMLAHAFDAGYKRAVFLVGAENLRSRRAMEKIGGALLQRTKTVVREGTPFEHVIYAISAESFSRGPLMTPG
jgi:N-acetyltransferase